MTLRELEGEFLLRTENGYAVIDDIAQAEGVTFLCPVCFEANKGPVGTHHVLCWSPKVPLDVPPVPGRWNLLGTGIDDLTLQAGSSSVSIPGSKCKAHFFIRGGRIEIC